ARSTSCLNNLKQIMLSLMMYADSNDGVTPPTSYKVPVPSAGTDAYLRWTGLLRQKNSLTLKVFQCPALHTTEADLNNIPQDNWWDEKLQFVILDSMTTTPLSETGWTRFAAPPTTTTWPIPTTAPPATS
ncbi:MAG: DUF1559 domain-containing protein, partial [Victivallales bacterium]|nr:DUF1559 domain-containing protein [Victivallales bacterium]